MITFLSIFFFILVGIPFIIFCLIGVLYIAFYAGAILLYIGLAPIAFLIKLQDEHLGIK